jgi:hypothetical protein
MTYQGEKEGFLNDCHFEESLLIGTTRNLKKQDVSLRFDMTKISPHPLEKEGITQVDGPV